MVKHCQPAAARQLPPRPSVAVTTRTPTARQSPSQAAARQSATAPPQLPPPLFRPLSPDIAAAVRHADNVFTPLISLPEEVELSFAAINLAASDLLHREAPSHTGRRRPRRRRQEAGCSGEAFFRQCLSEEKHDWPV
ncbi:protein phosphatase 2A regulatory B subunit family protein [Striga asiatica]|uniref:Protein phosphatase 2A regulatory B subunit family protein n=1 Tax=Striga asiatica TaxID=4170 RepID=A0A5A7QUZ9_STRAF|nr:protein phosphatase 2A regulatory B subunit family protein [Striga asiatica]